MRLPLRLGWLGLALFLILQGGETWAARSGRVDADQVDVLDAPRVGANVVDKLTRGSAVAASNYPVEGFHKVRTPSGKVGWISVNNLVLSPIPGQESATVASGAQKTATNRKPGNESSFGLPTSSSQGSPFSEKVKIRTFGGYSVFSSSGVVSGLSTFGGGLHFGGDVVFTLSPTFGLILRVERMMKSISLADSTTAKNFLMSLASTPIMGGLELRLAQGSKMALYLSLLAGIGLGTSLQSTNTSDDATNTATFAASPFTFMPKLGAHYSFGKVVSAYLGAGYRFLTTPTFTSTSSTPTLILESSFAVNLSGPMFEGGVSFAF